MQMISASICSIILDCNRLLDSVQPATWIWAMDMDCSVNLESDESASSAVADSGAFGLSVLTILPLAIARYWLPFGNSESKVWTFNSKMHSVWYLLLCRYTFLKSHGFSSSYFTWGTSTFWSTVSKAIFTKGGFPVAGSGHYFPPPLVFLTFL